MLLEKLEFDKKSFIKLFLKKFSNFIAKCPLFIQYQLLDDKVLIYDMSREKEPKPFVYDLNFTIGVKENIKAIKDELILNNYPTFSVSIITYDEPSTMDLLDLMIKTRLSFKDAMNTKNEIVSTINYRVEKILNQDNRLIIRNLNKNELALYQFHVPVIIFLQNLFKNDTSIEETFVNKSLKIKTITDTFKV
jgi:hypothetical protein